MNWQQKNLPLKGKSIGIIIKPDLETKLYILSEASKYDLAGSCAKDPRGRGRRRGPNNRWIYPVILPNGRQTTLFRTLISNVCVNDCAYCPLRSDRDPRRVSLSPEKTVRIFLEYFRKGWVHGLFISSGVIGNPDASMELLNTVGRILRYREGYKGYLHIKVIPGASKAAIEEAAHLADALSLNIEAPGEKNFCKLSQRKNYQKDIIEPLKFIAYLKRKTQNKGKHLSHTTQFVLGAAGEKDSEILIFLEGLYKRLRLNRVYFSAYQPGLGPPDLPGEKIALKQDLLTREHRLYQVDFLIRKYGFSVKEIPLKKGFLSLDIDPKEAWAQAHPEFFPVNINRASLQKLLRIPGIGPTLAKRILVIRKSEKITSLHKLTSNRYLIKKALPYIRF